LNYFIHIENISQLGLGARSCSSKSGKTLEQILQCSSKKVSSEHLYLEALEHLYVIWNLC